MQCIKCSRLRLWQYDMEKELRNADGYFSIVMSDLQELDDKLKLISYCSCYTTTETDSISSQSWYSQLQIYKTKIPHLFSDPTDSVPGDMAVPAIWKTILSFPMCTVATILRDKDGLSSTIDCHSLFLCNLNISFENKFELLKQNPVFYIWE